MRKPWVYIAGPITKGDTHGHVREAMVVFKSLHNHGLHPICPHWSALQQMSFPIEYEEWLAYDFETIVECDAVLRLPGESSGADREVEFARKNFVPVFESVNALLQYLGRTS